jgi:hypothetical protein
VFDKTCDVLMYVCYGMYVHSVWLKKRSTSGALSDLDLAKVRYNIGNIYIYIYIYAYVLQCDSP